MNPLSSFDFDVIKCIAELEKFERLLEQEELRESDDILPFFKKNLHLSAFVASYVAEIVRFDRIKHEFTFFGDFRADLVVGDSVNKTYCFIEFEDANQNSIFVNKGRSTSDWSPRFERGFSQIIDSQKIICITFDQLARDLKDRLSLYQLSYESDSFAEIDSEMLDIEE